jgi:peptide/nickel transport system substrate-binding protein
MKPFGLRLVAVSSLLVSLAYSATRPQYGGTAHVLLRAAPNSLDPAAPQPEPVSADNIFRLLYDTLVTIDDNGSVQPGLAMSWESRRDGRHWRFQLRPGVSFTDGSPLTSEAVAASLRQGNPWTVFSGGDSIEIDIEPADPHLPAELALARNSILKRGEGAPIGTGAFRVSSWSPAKELALVANEDFWGGRPFLNSIEIEFGKSYREQLTALELGRADLVEIAPEQAKRLEAGGRHISESAPLELIALLFIQESQLPNETKLREALALCIDRTTIRDVILGGEGELAGALLPNWMTGYEFLFPSGPDLAKALADRGDVNQAPLWTVSYDPADSVAQLIAERIILNARDVGLRVQSGNTANPDMRLVRIRLDSGNPWTALHNLSTRMALAQSSPMGASLEDLYHAEKALVQDYRVIPLFHLPINYGVGGTLKGWKPRRNGTWPMLDVWLKTGTN